MKNVRWTLYHRLLLLGMLPAVAMFVLMLLFFTQARLEDARQSLFRSTQLTADNLGPAVEFPLISGNQAELNGIISQTLKRSAAHRIEVINRNGDVLAVVSEASPPDATVHHFTSPVRQTAINLDAVGRRNGVNSMATDDWQENDGRRLGKIQIAVSEAELAGEQRDILWTSAGIGLILFAASKVRGGVR